MQQLLQLIRACLFHENLFFKYCEDDLNIVIQTLKSSPNINFQTWEFHYPIVIIYKNGKFFHSSKETMGIKIQNPKELIDYFSYLLIDDLVSNEILEIYQY